MDSRKSKIIPDNALIALASTGQYILSHSHSIYPHLNALFDLTEYPSVFEIELRGCRNGSEEKEVSETDIAQAERVLNNTEQYNLLSPIEAATYHEWLGIAYLENALSRHNNEEILKSFEHCNTALRIHFETLLYFQYHASLLKEISPAALHLKPLAKIAHYLGKIYYHLNYKDWSELCFSLELNIRTAFIFSTRVKDPLLAKACVSMGVVYSKSNQHLQALQYFQRAITAVEEHMEPLSWIWGKSCMELGMTYQKFGDMNFELAKIQQARKLQLNEEFPPNLLNQAHTHFLSASVYFKYAVDFYSNSPNRENQKRYRSSKIALAAIQGQDKKVCRLLEQHTALHNRPIMSQLYILSTQSFLRKGGTDEQPVRAPVAAMKTTLGR